MDTMNDYQDHRKPTSFAPEKAADYGDQFAVLSDILPSAQDVVKAIVVVSFMAIVLRGLPICSKLLSQYATKAEVQSATSGTEDCIAAPSVHPESQTPRLPAKRQRGNGAHVPREAIQDDDAEPICTQRSQFTAYNSVFFIEVNPGHSCLGLSETAIWDQPSDVRTITYFDNAGRTYRTKVARDCAERQRLAESLAEFPAMSSEQRLSLQKRAFARLEQLDMEQRMAVTP